jgi:hypothetical protein
MPANQYNTQTAPGNMKVGKGTIATVAAALAVVGTIFAQNFVGKGPNSSFIALNRAYLTPVVATACASGCDRTGSGGLAKYDTLLADSPYGAGAAAKGLRSGSGVVWRAQLDIIANPNGVSIDCTRVGGAGTATGGTLIFTDVSATGSIVSYNTPFTLGPTEKVKCGTLGTPGSSFRAELRLWMGDSRVIN